MIIRVFASFCFIGERPNASPLEALMVALGLVGWVAPIENVGEATQKAMRHAAAPRTPSQLNMADTI
jgi:hypothetical protein